MSTREIIACVVIGILLAFVGFFGYKCLSFVKKEKRYIEQIYSLQHSPQTVTVIQDTVKVRDSIYIVKPKPYSVVVYDTVLIPVKISYYDSIFRKDRLKFRWRSKVMGEIQRMSFTDIEYPKDSIMITKSIDTCFAKPAIDLHKTHWGLYTEMDVNNFKSFPGIGIGGQVVIKDQLTIGIGGVYLDKLYGNIRIGILFRR